MTFRSYFINILVADDVNSVHIDRLSKAIERILRKGAESILLATNNTVSANFDCACAVRYPTAVNKRALQDSLRFSAHIAVLWGSRSHRQPGRTCGRKANRGPR